MKKLETFREEQNLHRFNVGLQCRLHNVRETLGLSIEKPNWGMVVANIVVDVLVVRAKLNLWVSCVFVAGVVISVCNHSVEAVVFASEYIYYEKQVN